MSKPELPSHFQRLVQLTLEDPQLQNLMPDRAVNEAMQGPDLSYDQVLAIALDGYSERPALGRRAYEIELDPSNGRHVRRLLPRFVTITYADLHLRVKQLANTWHESEQHRVAPGEFVCELGFTGVDFATVDIACMCTRAVSVPLQSSMGRVALDGIFADTAPVAVAATVAEVVLAAELAGSNPSVRSIIVMDADEDVDEDRDRIAAARDELTKNGSAAQLAKLDELVVAGDAHGWVPLPPSNEGGERLAMLMHSSGSTGTPKGVMIAERNLKALFAAPAPEVPVVRLCCTPMSHTAGRAAVYTGLARGGTVNFVAMPDLSTLFEDIRLVRPTEGFFFPRVLEEVHRYYRGEVARRTRAGVNLAVAQADVKAQMRDSFLGDRLCLISVGSAPTRPEIKQFVVDCFAAAFVEGYGSTEVGSVTVNGMVNRSNVIDYRLRDLPELGYYSTDEPYPRGELCVKTKGAVLGYFKKPDATVALFDEDGYALTGDVMEQRGPDHLVYVGRRNDVIKLAQGEFVAAGALGDVFEDGSDLVHQIYVYGNASRAYLVAVVVPDLERVRLTLGDNPDEADVKALVRAELKRVAARLRSFEVPRDFLVETEPFSHENGLLTSLRKRIRPNLWRRYGEQLEALYTEIDRKQEDELLALRDPDSILSVLDRVGKALEATLGIEHVDVTQPSSFIELGGDSLGAVSFAALLSEIFGVDVPLNSIVSPAGNPAQWARAIEVALRHESDGRPTYANVHGDEARELHASDLRLGAFIDAQTLAAAPTAPPVDVSRTVLITGATGFLGRFLALEWLERLAPIGGTLICLVRGHDTGSARRRLAGVYSKGGDAELDARYQALAHDHLEVVVGDVAERGLGIDPAEFDRLAAEVDRVVHTAALVNHMLGYEHLFTPNVAGTAELIRLALTGRMKFVDFVSSAAVLGFLDHSQGANETSPLLPDVAVGDGYARGYGASKWAAELLLHRAHQTFGLPVSIFRGNMMLPHQLHHGQINVEDIFTRLLYSVITTGLAPVSFYRLGPDGSRPKAHYDGMPVDFIAAAIAAIGAQPHRDLRTFHISSSHADEPSSLDEFVDWIEDAGYPVERVGDHAEWLARFEAKLRALPEDKRQLSSLAVIDSLHAPSQPRHEVGSERFHAALATTPLGPATPQLTRGFIEKCLADMRRLGLINAPTRASRDRAPGPTRDQMQQGG